MYMFGDSLGIAGALRRFVDQHSLNLDWHFGDVHQSVSPSQPSELLIKKLLFLVLKEIHDFRLRDELLTVVMPLVTIH